MPDFTDEELMAIAGQSEKSSLIMPVPGNPSSGFNSMRGNRKHAAIDIPGEPGTPVVAPINMELYETGMGGSGLRNNDYWSWWKTPTGMVKMAHHDDLRHLKPGTQVEQGQPFTVIGNVISNPHIHMKLEDVNGKPIDITPSSLQNQGQPQLPNQGISDEELMRIADSKAAGPRLAIQEKKLTYPKPPSLQAMVGKGIEENLPLMGMMGGGALGAPAGLIGGPVGAGLGYAAGQSAQNMLKSIRGEPLPTPGEQLIQGTKGVGIGATGEMGGQIFGKMVEGVVGGAAKKGIQSVEDIARYQMAQDLAAQGVHLDPMTIGKPGPFTKGIAWLVNKFEPGKSIAQAYRNKALNAILEMRYKFVEDVMGLPPVGAMRAGEAPSTVAKVFARFRETNPTAQIPLVNTKAWLSGLKETDIPKKSQELYNLALSRSQTGTFTPGELESFNKSIWEGYRKLTTADRQFRNELLSNIYKDLPQDIGSALKFAKVTTREIKQAKMVEGMLNQATSPDGQMFFPFKFYQVVRRNEDGIMRSLDPVQAKTVFNFAEQMKLASETANIAKEAGRRESPFWQAVSSGPGVASMVGAYAGHPALILPMGAQGWMAWSLMKPSGTLNKLLTSGLPTLSGKVGLATKIGLTKTIEDKLGLND